MIKPARGFSLIELIAVVVILAVLAVTVTSRFAANTHLQLQASRDAIVAALFMAQQRAMAQTAPVRVVTGGNQLDIEQDNGSGWQSVLVGGTQYPLTLSPGQTIGNQTLGFDRLGRTTATDLVLSQGASAVTISVSASGFSQ